MNRPIIDRILNLEKREAGGLNLLSVSQGSVKLRVIKIGHIINRSMYSDSELVRDS